MTNKFNRETEQPIIVKYINDRRNGIQPHNLTRQCLGYVLQGHKYVYNGDSRQVIKPGEIFFMSVGLHYTENVPEGDHPFEQIIFYYTPEQLNRTLSRLSVDFGLEIRDNHSCPDCQDNRYVIYPAWKTAKDFFNSVNNYLEDGALGDNYTADNLKLTELIYLVVSQPDCCLKKKILEHTDQDKGNFEHIIRSHIFTNASIEELANKCSCCPSTFKKEFKKHFHEPPHRWFMKQRLMHARLLLISTEKSISEICNECMIPNPSHFIKLFKKEYGMTPLTYRNKYNEEERREKEESFTRKSKTVTSQNVNGA